MEMLQNVTLISFVIFDREIDVKNRVGGYVSIRTFCTLTLKSIL